VDTCGAEVVQRISESREAKEGITEVKQDEVFHYWPETTRGEINRELGGGFMPLLFAVVSQERVEFLARREADELSVPLGADGRQHVRT